MLRMKIFDDLADSSVEMALNGMNHVEVVDNMLLYIMASQPNNFTKALIQRLLPAASKLQIHQQKVTQVVGANCHFKALASEASAIQRVLEHADTGPLSLTWSRIMMNYSSWITDS